MSRDARLYFEDIIESASRILEYAKHMDMDTILLNLDLSRANGPEAVRHQGPSEISISTLHKSGVHNPESFLRGCATPDTLIAFARAARQAVAQCDQRLA